MINKHNSFLREIHKEVRREKIVTFWNKYAKFIIAVFTSLAIFYFVWSYQFNSQNVSIANTGAQFSEIMQFLAEGKQAEAALGFEQIVEEGSGGYVQLSLLRLAAHARRNNRPNQAMQYYQQISSDASTDTIIRDFAKLQLVNLKHGMNDWDKTKISLQELINSNSPWKYIAQETLSLEAYRVGEFEEAKELLAQILASKNVSKFSLQRAKILMRLTLGKLKSSSPKERTDAFETNHQH
ncbi:MAG TPA: hypothetical protein TECP_00614 [Hyphomicrobiaceae bacterium MAG_BT-2024]